MGLSPHLEIEFKRNKKKRKHTALDRYYHHDTSMDADEVTRTACIPLANWNVTLLVVCCWSQFR